MDILNELFKNMLIPYITLTSFFTYGSLRKSVWEDERRFKNVWYWVVVMILIFMPVYSFIFIYRLNQG